MASEGHNFQVVIEKQPGNDYEIAPEQSQEEADEIQPDHYYEDGGIPVFKPTMDQFRSFKGFVDKINHYGMKSGIVKIIPPQEWYETLAPLEEKVKDIRIKNPIVQHIAGMQGEYRQENVEKQRTYNLPQWRQLCEGAEHQPPARRGERRKGQVAKETAKAREAEQAMLDDEAFEGFDYQITNADEYTPERCEELEKAYWRTLTYSNPLYGADMPGSLFDDRTKSWNVAHLENLLDCLGKKLPGVNTAYLYLGMWRSTFAWHLEDMDLYSINYIHFGAPKQWYSISRSDKAKFEEVMKRTWPNDSKKCTEFLRHKSYLVSPSLLANAGIKVNKVVHHQGEFIITFPYGYHSGYNMGYNCAESVNFATESWLEYGRTAKKCECIKDSVWIDVAEIERKLRGESTEDEYEEVEYYGGYDDEDDEDQDETMDLPTPPESVEGKTAKLKSRPRKRKAPEDGSEAPIKIKRLKLKFSKAPQEPEPCILCPNNIPSEELVATDDGRDAHRLCAIYTPETFFSWDPSIQKEVVANVNGIPKARIDLKCVFCRSKKGACFQCSSKKCTRAYHATCAAAAGVLVNMVDVPVFGEDGQYYTRTEIDFRCRFHRPKRAKDIDIEHLENDPLIRSFGSHLIKGDVIQMQFLKGEIFAGVVIENRRSEEMVLIQVLPKGDICEIEWKWILAQDPSTINIPEPLTEMPLNPTPQQAGIATRRVPKEIPDIDDCFGGPTSGLKWAEFVVERPAFNEDQAPVDFTKPFWHYLGELSTEYISKYSEDPRRRIPNEAANLIPSRKPKPRRQTLPKAAAFNSHMQNATAIGYMGYPQGISRYQEQLQQHQAQQRRFMYNHPPSQGYHGAPVAPMVGQPPQHQLWPPIYRPTDFPMQHVQDMGANMPATGQFMAQSVDQRRAAHMAAAALSMSPHGIFSNDIPSQVSSGLAEMQVSNAHEDNASSIAAMEDTIIVTSPIIQKADVSPNPQLVIPLKFEPQDDQSSSNTAKTNTVPIPAPTTPPQLNRNNPLSTPSSGAPNPPPQQGSEAPPQPKPTPTKVVPLADIQAALARLAKAKADTEARKRSQEQAQSSQAQSQAA
ncbi:JmjC domain, hydroxylase-domain-containing protein [Morchella snyderi]|nr:JmjC domain, hydroxylase-domain-containing protein [Morchella snyderi]